MSLTEVAQRCVDILEYKLQRVRYSRRPQGFSHSSEEQILRKYIDELLPIIHQHSVVDIGAGNGVRWSNSYSLFRSGWKGVGIEADERKFAQLTRVYKNFPLAHACHSQADPANICSLLKSLDVEKDFSVLSLDIDGNDYWVLKAILTEFRPALIVTEINEKIPPPLRFLVKYDPAFQLRRHFFGYSIAMLGDLCDEYDYGILELEYNNAFIARRDIAAGRFIDAATAYSRGYRDRPGRQERFSANFELEALNSLPPAQAIEFLNEFYSSEKGKYYLSLDKEALAKALPQ